MREIVDQALKAGEHVHVATRDGMRCAGGDDTCTAPRTGSLVLTRVVQTCTSNPAQWNAWTDTGQYLYLRYRFGVGTVHAHDNEDPKTWTPQSGTLLVSFATGGPLRSDISIEDFCEHAGLELAWAEMS